MCKSSQHSLLEYYTPLTSIKIIEFFVFKGIEQVTNPAVRTMSFHSMIPDSN